MPIWNASAKNKYLSITKPSRVVLEGFAIAQIHKEEAAMKKFTPPWRDPVSDPPEHYTEVIITTEAGRVTSATYGRGRWNTYTPIRCWHPMPPPGKEIKDETPPLPAEPPANPKSTPKKGVAKRKTKV